MLLADEVNLEDIMAESSSDEDQEEEKEVKSTPPGPQ